MTTLTATAASTSTASRVDRTPLVAATVGLMTATGFAMLAIVPLGFLLRRTLRDPALARLRPWSALLAGVYAVPLVLWAALPDRAPSLSKDMDPVFVPVIAATAVLYVGAWLLGRRAHAT